MLPPNLFGVNFFFGPCVIGPAIGLITAFAAFFAAAEAARPAAILSLQSFFIQDPSPCGSDASGSNPPLSGTLL